MFKASCNSRALLFNFLCLCTGVKKPPLAPKPKLPVTTKPPIAPKPGSLSQSSVVSQTSPSTLKRPKPAVAPKPCLPKSTTSPPPAPPLKPTDPFRLSQEEQETSDDNLLHLNSRNGFLSEAGGGESDYIIPTCPCGGPEDCSRGGPQENGEEDFHGELLPNGVTETKLQELPAADKVERISKKPRDKPQRQRHLDRGPVNKETQRTEGHRGGGLERGQHEESAAGVLTETDSADSTAACDVAGNIDVPTSTAPPETSHPPDLEVPAAPSKPLPVPHPRRLKKPALVRQDGVEGSVQDQVVEEGKQEEDEPQEVEGKLSPDCGAETLNGSGSGEADVPVPPPRQTSLSPRLHRSVHSSLNKSASHSLELLSEPEGEALGKQQVEEDEEDAYGDFERYPISHSLPKQLQLGGPPPLSGSRRALSSKESPRTPPRKPQRHSMPAPPPPPICPPAPPHANTPMRELPAPPQEKPAWRFTRPCVTFFSRQMPTRSSVPPKGRAPSLGGKQRAQSFSAADLATRVHPQKRSLSFRKLLELRLSMKMLPKLLAKGGQSLDCTSVETTGGGRSLQRPTSCIEDSGICGEGVEGSVEYENVPLYEEIPEYMNLPFHGARLGWPQDPEAGESDIYEVQGPFPSCQDHQYER